MDPRLIRFLAVAVLVAASSAAIGGVVRDKTGNPGLLRGGQPITHHGNPEIPYSLVGAIADSRAAWPWEWTFPYAPVPYAPIPFAPIPYAPVTYAPFAFTPFAFNPFTFNPFVSIRPPFAPIHFRGRHIKP
jgi:hypothetical protein